MKKQKDVTWFKIENSDKKVWVIPRKNIKMALCIYQPSNLKGILLKEILPVVNLIYPIARGFFNRVGITMLSNPINQKMEGVIKKFFPESSELFYSFFLGTPGTHKKTTIQIYDKNRILGYVKVTENIELFSLFQRERQMLSFLRECNVENIPVCFFCDKINEMEYIFAQDTQKTQKSLGVHDVIDVHYSFLKNLYNRTKKVCRFDETDYFYMLERLEKNMKLYGSKVFSDEQTKMMINAIAYARRKLERMNVFSVCHRDFTPWNMFINESKELYVFDFEYAEFTYPPFLDLCHYIVQSSIYEKHLKVDEILKRLQTTEIVERLAKEGYETTVKEMMVLYLIDVIELYFSREKVALNIDTVMNIRFELLNRLLI